ncbi:MAG: response regulator transcription factor [Candidatus Aminicenantes bacterium]|nr:response regulator transcription factor [Candidatus Aminicenantes bacterium]
MTKSASEGPHGKAKILCVEDDINLQKSLSFILWREGYEVLCAQTGEEALELVRREKPDLVLLDLMLPGIDGYKVCSILRKDPGTSEILIIMVTAKKRMEDIVAGLKNYADDYVTKPFDPEVLLARIEALLRRRIKSSDQAGTTLEIDGLVINRGAYEVLAGGRKIALTKTEFEILALLAGKPNQVFTRSRILDNVREDGYPITERVVDYHLTGLRRKLGKTKRYIQTVRGVGYKFSVE